MPNDVFSVPVKVYLEDTDAGGRVYHPNYLKYAERARTEMLRSLGVSKLDWLHTHSLQFVIASLTIEYKAPAFLEDDLCVKSVTVKRTKIVWVMRQEFFKGEKLIATLEVKLALVGEKGTPIPFPEVLFSGQGQN